MSLSSTVKQTKNSISAADEEYIHVTQDAATATANNIIISIPKPSDYVRNIDNGSQAAILRSLHAAGVKFVRFTIVDAYNTIRCKSVPISHALSKLPNRTQRYSNILHHATAH